MAKYIHTAENGIVGLREKKSIIINNDKVDIKPIVLRFTNHTVDTSGMREEEEAIRLMDKWMAENPKQKFVTKAPSEAELKKMNSVAKKIEKAKQKAVEEVLSKNADSEAILEEKQEFDAFVEKTKKTMPVKGMMDVR